MFTRLALITATAAAVLVAVPGTANAKATTEVVDRSLFDATPERTDSTLRVDGPTSGPLGGAMELTVQAADGTLPTELGACEAVRVRAAVTVRPGLAVTVRTRGEVCAHTVDGSLTVNASYRNKNVSFRGPDHGRHRLVGEGFIAAAHSQLGGQASFYGTFRW